MLANFQQLYKSSLQNTATYKPHYLIVRDIFMNWFVHLIELKCFCFIQACIEKSLSLVLLGSSIKEFVQPREVVALCVMVLNVMACVAASQQSSCWGIGSVLVNRLANSTQSKKVKYRVFSLLRHHNSQENSVDQIIPRQFLSSSILFRWWFLDDW